MTAFADLKALATRVWGQEVAEDLEEEHWQTLQDRNFTTQLRLEHATSESLIAAGLPRAVVDVIIAAAGQAFPLLPLFPLLPGSCIANVLGNASLEKEKNVSCATRGRCSLCDRKGFFFQHYACPKKDISIESIRTLWLLLIPWSWYESFTRVKSLTGALPSQEILVRSL